MLEGGFTDLKKTSYIPEQKVVCCHYILGTSLQPFLLTGNPITPPEWTYTRKRNVPFLTWGYGTRVQETWVPALTLSHSHWMVDDCFISLSAHYLILDHL